MNKYVVVILLFLFHIALKAQTKERTETLYNYEVIETTTDKVYSDTENLIGCDIEFKFRGKIYKGILVSQDETTYTISFVYMDNNRNPLSALCTIPKSATICIYPKK